ncbi:hypothetical protein GOP47_0005342 [Adiantum capillus-veneris]|uniref:Uncharacterized protein n=1 Tax=Adiantum capillus-veneris TaxID=13818 RepID=A0A9D4V624_ADICA|nr:hypothetical protein GOP47_0005342 [Adiantum capillus-veneris]
MRFNSKRGSFDRGMGSLAKEPQTARQEATLDLVPFHIAPEVAPCVDEGDDIHLHGERGEDILKTTRVFTYFGSPTMEKRAGLLLKI